MFLYAAIDSGIGLTAGKKLCGKAIAQSDDTYLTTVHLREKFIQLKRFLAIQEQPKIETEKLESLKTVVNKLQEDLTQQRLITDTISQENIRVKKEMGKLQPLLEFINGFQDEKQLQLFMELLKTSSRIDFPEKGTFVKIDLSDEMLQDLDKVAKRRGISRQEAIDQLIDEGIEALSKGNGGS